MFWRMAVVGFVSCAYGFSVECAYYMAIVLFCLHVCFFSP